MPAPIIVTVAIFYLPFISFEKVVAKSLIYTVILYNNRDNMSMVGTNIEK